MLAWCCATSWSNECMQDLVHSQRRRSVTTVSSAAVPVRLAVRLVRRAPRLAQRRRRLAHRRRAVAEGAVRDARRPGGEDVRGEALREVEGVCGVGERRGEVEARVRRGRAEDACCAWCQGRECALRRRWRPVVERPGSGAGCSVWGGHKGAAAGRPHRERTRCAPAACVRVNLLSVWG